MSKPRLTLSTLGALLAAGMGALLLFLVVSPSLEAQIESAKQAGDSILSSLNDFHAIHDRYPESLRAAGIASPKTSFGCFDYTPVPDDDSFILGVGDHTTGGIRVFRMSGASEWTVWK